MAFAILAISALLLPWIAGYLALGIVLGPLLLLLLHRAYGTVVHPLRDVPTAIVCWVAILARILVTEAREA